MTNAPDASNVVYENYPPYKVIYDEFEFLLPIELPEDIIHEIIYTLKSRSKIRNEPLERVNDLKQVLDEKFGKYWHVFCGKNFGAFSVHDKYRFAFFKYKTMSYLIYKTTY